MKSGNVSCQSLTTTRPYVRGEIKCAFKRNPSLLGEDKNRCHDGENFNVLLRYVAVSQ